MLAAGNSSSLDPAGVEASRIAALFWGLTIGATLVWIVVIGLAFYATYFARAPQSAKGGVILIVVGGVVVPTVVLAAVLTYSLALLPELLRPAPDGTLRINVTGHQWWWRVRYRPEGRPQFELANELHLPVGQPVELELDSPDVIHSFWVPALGGKMDMIPGRRTRLRLQPTKTGVYRGVCAEYCGTAHALMAFYVVVEEQAAFEGWLSKEAGPAAADAPSEGAELFLSHGCGACHSIRGTRADGVVGPDLTHVGGRLSVGAGVLEAGARGFHSWIAETGRHKPGVHMPAFGMLPPRELEALAAYLAELR